MGFLFASSKKRNIPEITGLQIQTAVNVLPIPIIYGTPRVPMNIIYANGFRSVKQKAGGKGLLGGGKGQTTGYKYYATFIGSLGEGEINNIAAVFDNQQVYTPATIPPGKTMVFFNGSSAQTAWSYIVTNWPDDAFGYKDTCYIGFQDFELDASATIPQMNFLPVGKFAGTCPLNKYTAPDNSEWFFDADPAQVVYDFLTNARYGATFPAAYIDTDTLWTSANGLNPLVGDAALSTYCQAVGFGWSLALNNAEPASSILDRLFKNIVVAPVWTGSILKFIPYYDSPSSLNPGFDAESGGQLKYYTPDTDALFELNDDDYIQDENDEDPVTMTRVDVADVKSVVRVNFRDRFNYFNDNVAEAKDELQVELYGPRTDRMGPADEFSHINYAATAAELQKQRNIAIRRTFSFRLGPQWCILDPMDILVINESTLGLEDFSVRIREIEEDEDGFLNLTVEEFPNGATQVVAYDRQEDTPPTFVDTGAVAPDVNTPAIFEPTTQYLESLGYTDPVVMVGVSGGPNGVYSTLWGGADIWISTDDISYQYVDTIFNPARTGKITAILNSYSGSNPDNTNTLSISLAESDGELESVTDSQASMGVSLCAIIESDGSYELLGYTTATLTGANTYDLTGLYRGMFGTIACEHAADSKFVRIDDYVKSIALQPAFVDTLLYIKFLSFNIFNQGYQEISDVDPYQFTPLGFATDSNNILVQALRLHVDVDLNTFDDSTLDLNAGGGGHCAPIVFEFDLGEF